MLWLLLSTLSQHTVCAFAGGRCKDHTDTGQYTLREPPPSRVGVHTREHPFQLLFDTCTVKPLTRPREHRANTASESPYEL